MNIAHLLLSCARARPDFPAVSVGTKPPIMYRDFAQRVQCLAAGIRDLDGVAHGDRVALVMSNCPQYLELLWAIWTAGLCAVPINAKLHPREIAFILNDTGAVACFSTPELAQPIQAIRGKLPDVAHVIDVQSRQMDALGEAAPMTVVSASDDEPAWIFYTSGTTGKPKGAVLTHRNLLGMALRYYADIDAVQPGDTAFALAPLSHASGLMAIPHMARGGHQVIPESGGFDVDEVFSMIRSHQRISFFAAPTMLMRMVDHPDCAIVPWRHVTTLVYGGAPMYVEDLRRAIAAVGPCLVQGYGQGESPITISVLDRAAHQESQHPDYECRLASVGVARLGVELRVVGETGEDVPPGSIGEVIVRSDVTMSGYWRNPVATAAAIREGWLFTGDIGTLSTSGFLTLKDRSKDVIISGGSNVYPREVEEILLKHPAVRECAVVGKPSAEWGEEVAAFIVSERAGPAFEQELDQLCLDNIARFKRPKSYLFLQELPKSSYGKILKSELRRMLRNA